MTERTIAWEPAVYISGIGRISLTMEQVRSLCDQAKESQKVENALMFHVEHSQFVTVQTFIDG